MAEPAETLTGYLARHPEDAALAYRVRRFPRLCPVHRRPLLTAVGWTIRMDVTPSSRWMDISARYPFGLWLGTALERSETHCDPMRLVFCPDCVESVARLDRAPYIPEPKPPRKRRRRRSED